MLNHFLLKDRGQSIHFSPWEWIIGSTTSILTILRLRESARVLKEEKVGWSLDPSLLIQWKLCLPIRWCSWPYQLESAEVADIWPGGIWGPTIPLILILGASLFCTNCMRGPEFPLCKSENVNQNLNEKVSGIIYQRYSSWPYVKDLCSLRRRWLPQRVATLISDWPENEWSTYPETLVLVASRTKKFLKIYCPQLVESGKNLPRMKGLMHLRALALSYRILPTWPPSASFFLWICTLCSSPMRKSISVLRKMWLSENSNK